MIRKFVLPLIAVLGIAFAVRTSMKAAQPVIAAPPVAQPAQAPYEGFVAGAGIVEPSTENIAIGTQVPGVVTDIFVKVGDRVQAGAPLFKIDDRSLQAELAVRQTALTAAQKKLERLQNLPRPEDIPAVDARVKAAQAQRDDMKAQLAKWQSVQDKRAISRQELEQAQFAAQAAEAKLREAQAELSLLRAGSWKPDIEIAQADIAAAQAQVQASQTEIERLTVKAPIDGQILQLKVRLGEYAPAGELPTPLIMMGDVDVLHVRADVDEHDAWRVKPDAKAMAAVRGNKDLQTELKFVRFEPYIVPKRSLTGDSTERVDTRVLQIIYSFDPHKLPVYVGQQMDVFIQADQMPVGATPPGSPSAGVDNKAKGIGA